MLGDCPSEIRWSVNTVGVANMCQAHKHIVKFSTSIAVKNTCSKDCDVKISTSFRAMQEFLIFMEGIELSQAIHENANGI